MGSLQSQSIYPIILLTIQFRSTTELKPDLSLSRDIKKKI